MIFAIRLFLHIVCEISEVCEDFGESFAGTFGVFLKSFVGQPRKLMMVIFASVVLAIENIFLNLQAIAQRL